MALSGSQQLEAGNRREPWVQLREAQETQRDMDERITLPEAQHPNLEVSGCGKLSLGEAALEACWSSLKTHGGSVEEDAFAVSLPLEPRSWCLAGRAEAKSETWM